MHMHVPGLGPYPDFFAFGLALVVTGNTNKISYYLTTV